MTLDLFAVTRVSDYDTAVRWYSQLWGAEPSFLPNDVEAVWELAEHRYLYIEAERGRPGGGLLTVFTEDLDEVVQAAAARGIEPDETETYSNGVRKVIFRDPDGNEIGFGGPPD